MNRIDRLFATLLILQQRSLVCAEELAQRFGSFIDGNSILMLHTQAV